MKQIPVEENFIEVALIDDHVILRQALKNALFYHGNIKVTVEASNYSELLDKLSSSRINIIIMDLDMPNLDKTKSTIGKIYQLIPEAKILILTMHNEDYIKRELIKFGIFSFLFKGADFEELMATILVAAQGVSADFDFNSVEDRYTERRFNRRDVKSVIFSEREKQILKLIAMGKTNIEISKVAFLSVRSIEEIRRNMKDRANVTNTASLIDFAFRNRVIE